MAGDADVDAPWARVEPRQVHELLSGLPIKKKVKLASKGTREQRAQLIRDPNKLVAAAVLLSAVGLAASMKVRTMCCRCPDGRPLCIRQSGLGLLGPDCADACAKRSLRELGSMDEQSEAGPSR